MSKLVLITGCLGGIGRALVKEFDEAGFTVVGLDVSPVAASGGTLPQHYFNVDLDQLCLNAAYRERTLNDVKTCLAGRLDALVNNAAHQVVKPIASLSVDDWIQTQNVNVMAPFLLTQALLPELTATQGNVINIASIHAQLTKPEFVAYATSKAALLGMTKAMAVELGAAVQVNAICPAAIATPMLVAGFEGCPEGLAQLASMHPVGRIGQPSEVAKAAVLLASKSLSFMSGATLQLDGGIGARLHDPV
jgi:NAD(P)-dependent dehydrogenase (short-subunit alcohol dehydrogenase family)